MPFQAERPSPGCPKKSLVSLRLTIRLVEIAPHYYKKKDIDDDAGKKLPKGVGKAADRGGAAAAGAPG